MLVFQVSSKNGLGLFDLKNEHVTSKTIVDIQRVYN